MSFRETVISLKVPKIRLVCLIAVFEKSNLHNVLILHRLKCWESILFYVLLEIILHRMMMMMIVLFS